MTTTPRHEFIALMKEISKDNAFSFESYSQDWIIKITDGKNKKSCLIYGYSFSINSAAASEICREKPAASRMLHAVNIPHIPHSIFLNPGSELAGPYVSQSGNWSKIVEFFEANGRDVVLKPLRGTGGLDVFRAKTIKDLEISVSRLFSKDYGLAMSPYIALGTEWRVFCLEGKAKLIYAKNRLEIVGDGKLCLSRLLTGLLLENSEHGDIRAISQAISRFSQEELKQIPYPGQRVPIEWRHNIGLGTTDICLEVEEELSSRLCVLAEQAVSALGISFCSVDIADSVHDGSLIVVEVNSGVMMDNFIKDPERRKLAKSIYSEAINRSLS